MSSGDPSTGPMPLTSCSLFSKPTTSMPYSGCALELAVHEPRFLPAADDQHRCGGMTRGKIQLRIEPRMTGTKTSATTRKSAASTADEIHQPFAYRNPCEMIRIASEPASIAWKTSRTSSKLATEIRRRRCRRGGRP